MLGRIVACGQQLEQLSRALGLRCKLSTISQRQKPCDEGQTVAVDEL